jgi:Cu(I)/Ag(I) efflux system periplasmic protein CusF
MTRNSILIVVLLLGAGLAFHAGADVSHNQLAQNEAKPAAAASAEWTAGEVRKVDKAAGKVTIKHGPIPKLDMSAMTMAYGVKDKAMLDHLKPGDKIKFDVDRVDGAFKVMRLEKAK